MTKDQTVKRHLLEAIVFAILVAAGASLRLALQEVPNFAPVAALALFAGYFFRSRLLAMGVPLAIMAITDLKIGGYAWYQMAVVYAMLALPVLLRGPLRRAMALDGSSRKRAALSLAGLLGCSLASSILFYVATNAVCLGWYEPTLAGVVQCYVQGLPFFKYTLAGDMLFSLATFGTYAAVMQLGAATRGASSIAQPNVEQTLAADEPERLVPSAQGGAACGAALG
jgi:hypothetical protein